VYLEKIVADEFTEYVTTSGIYLDRRDQRDGKSYYYMSFVYNYKYTQIIKIDIADGSVKWNF
jgi:hypothetical protein